MHPTLPKMHHGFSEMHPEKPKMHPTIFLGCIFLSKYENVKGTVLLTTFRLQNDSPVDPSKPFNLPYGKIALFQISDCGIAFRSAHILQLRPAVEMQLFFYKGKRIGI